MLPPPLPTSACLLVGCAVRCVMVVLNKGSSRSRAESVYELSFNERVFRHNTALREVIVGGVASPCITVACPGRGYSVHYGPYKEERHVNMGTSYVWDEHRASATFVEATLWHSKCAYKVQVLPLV